MEDLVTLMARTLIHHSTRVQPHETVLLEIRGTSARPLMDALVREVHALGATPVIDLMDFGEEITRRNALTKREAVRWGQEALARMQAADVVIQVNAVEDRRWLARVDAAKRDLHRTHIFNPVQAVRLTKRYVITTYPTEVMARKAGLSLRNCSDAILRACALDYARLRTCAAPLAELVAKAQHLRVIAAQDTDLAFSIARAPFRLNTGTYNLPDGEFLLAPERGTAQGVFTTNTFCTFQGHTFGGVRLRFRDGRIDPPEAASCQYGSQAHLRRILAADEGSCQVGAVSLGLNPGIRRVFGTAVVDEKLAGAVVVCMGNQEPYAKNGVASVIHFPLILRLGKTKIRQGRILLDDEVIAQDGHFVHPALADLEAFINP